MTGPINNQGGFDPNIGDGIEPGQSEEGRIQHIGSGDSETRNVDRVSSRIALENSGLLSKGSSSSEIGSNEVRSHVSFGGITVKQLDHIRKQATTVNSGFRSLEKTFPNIYETSGVSGFLMSGKGEKYLESSVEEPLMNPDEIEALVNSLQLGRTKPSENEGVSENNESQGCSPACRKLLHGIRRLLTSIAHLFIRLKTVIIDFFQRVFSCLKRGKTNVPDIPDQLQDLADYASLLKKDNQTEKSGKGEGEMIYSELDFSSQSVSGEPWVADPKVVYAAVSQAKKDIPESAVIDSFNIVPNSKMAGLLNDLGTASHVATSISTLITTSLNSQEDAATISDDTSAVEDLDTLFRAERVMIDEDDPSDVEDVDTLFRAERVVIDEDDASDIEGINGLRGVYLRLTSQKEELSECLLNIRTAFAFWKGKN